MTNTPRLVTSPEFFDDASLWVAELNFQLRCNYPSIEEQASTAFELEWAAGEPISLLSSSMMNGPGGWVVVLVSFDRHKVVVFIRDSWRVRIEGS